MLLVGAVPLVVGMGMALLQGTQELHQMAGVNFESLAAEAARTMDLVFSDELTRTARIARSPLLVETLRNATARLESHDEAKLAAASTAKHQWESGDAQLLEAVTENYARRIFFKQQVARPEGETGQIIPASCTAATVALFVTDSRGNVVASTTSRVPYASGEEEWWRTAYDHGVGQTHMGNVYFDAQFDLYAFHLSLPIPG